jgi:hypothetical protein
MSIDNKIFIIKISFLFLNIKKVRFHNHNKGVDFNHIFLNKYKVKIDCIKVEVVEENDNPALTEVSKKLFLNSKRYVTLSQIQLGSRKFEDVEVDSYENCVFLYRNQKIELKCKILSIAIVKELPGLIKNESKNIKRSTHSEYNFNKIQNPVKKSSMNSNQIKETSSKNSSIEISSISSSANSKASTSLTFTSDNTKNGSATENEDNDLTAELDLNEIFKLAEKKHFPKKEFIINNKKKAYAPMLHFFKSIRVFNKHPEEHERFKYECKICKSTFISPFTDNSNLYKHLNRHEDYSKWNKKYCEFKGTKIKEKLEKAEDVCLMSDIWTNMQNSDFIAIVMGLMNANFKREVLVADMMRVPGDSHTAENIKIAIETMVKN